MSSSGECARSYLVECYWPGVSEEDLAVAGQRARAAVSELRRDGRELRFLGSILVPADETVFCLFDGLEEDVRTASAQAGIPFERVLHSLRIDGGFPATDDPWKESDEDHEPYLSRVTDGSSKVCLLPADPT